MPRPCSRRYLPYLKTLKAIALDEQQPTALRVRSAELSVAILSQEWSVASSRATRKAVRGVIAADAIDQRLLEVSGIQQDLEQRNDAPAFAEQKGNEMELQHERQRNKLKAVLAETSFTPELLTAVKKQLAGMDAAPAAPAEPGEPGQAQAVQPEPEITEKQKLADLKLTFDRICTASTAQLAEDAATLDQREKVCGTCFFRQGISNLVCALCERAAFIAPSLLTSEQRILSANSNLDLAGLNSATRSNWAGAGPARGEFLQLHIALRKAAAASLDRQRAEAEASAEPSRITPEQVDAASRSYLHQISKLSAEIEQLKKQENI
jgi:hypothetical protein